MHPRNTPRVAQHVPAALLAAMLWAACSSARAHDSWLRPLPEQPGAGLLALELGVGSRYPKAEFSIAADSIVQSACLDAGGRRIPLLVRAQRTETLELRSRVGDAAAATCWLELRPHTVELTPELVRTYLAEIRAPRALREAWAQQQASGGGWQETYRKFIRIELPALGAAAPADLSALRRPLGAGLELVPLGGTPIEKGVTATFQALTDGKPLPGLAVEFVNRRSPVGIWRETDAEGRINLALPLAGEWLLRSTSLEPPPGAGQPWRSRFSTLTIDVR